ncbi:MAG: heparinase II/III domain-containing protein [Candidatus Helarchaeota archaeon]
MSKKQVLILSFIGLLIVFNALVFSMALMLFPAHGGFTRSILFVHPDDSQNTGGYFIVIDELASVSQKFNIDWVLHGRGSVNISDNFQSVKYQTQSYISNDNISVNVTFLSPVEQITTHEGIFFPAYRYDGPDHTPTYFKARYSGNAAPLMGTVLYPRNESDISLVAPQISPITETQMGQIGEADLIYYQSDRTLRIFSIPNTVQSDAKVLFIHKNASDSLQYCFVQESTSLSFASQAYFTSTSPVENLLINYANFTEQITGYLNIGERTMGTISIYVPFAPASLVIDGASHPFTTAGPFITFDLRSGAFVISKSSVGGEVTHEERNPLQTTQMYEPFPARAVWEFNVSKISDLSHPYLFFNDTELATLREKLNQSVDPWKSWYESYTANVDTLKGIDISTLDEDARWVPTRQLALKFAVDGGQEYFNKVMELLLDMPNIEDDYNQDLKRADAVRAYAFAYDVVYNNISASNRSVIGTYLYDHAHPLTEMDLYSDNNHRPRDATGLGLAGLVLQDKRFIDIATEAILTYLYEKVRPDGGSYEGQSYGASAFYGSIEFLNSLRRFGGYNIFNDSRFLRMLNFMAESLSPLALPPVYEDCVVDGRTNTILAMAAAHLEDLATAEEYQWLWESRENNSDLIGLDSYTYLLDYGAPLQLISIYDVPTKLNITQPNYTSNVYKESGMGFLRSGYTQDAIFLSFSCKHFPQSHPHYDENSFELWAYGAWLIHNSGYPGWGKEGHDFCIDTVGANTLLINGAPQLFEKAGGLASAILSPYFEIVQGDATSIYNSPGSIAESLNAYLLMILTFGLLGASAFLYLHTKYTMPKSGSAEKLVTTPEAVGTTTSERKTMKQDGVPFTQFLRASFLRPLTLQEKILDEDQKTNIKRFKLLIAGIITLSFLIYLLYLLNIINFHIGELILTWQLPFSVNDFYLIELGLVVIVLGLTLLTYYAVIRLFARICNAFCSDVDAEFPNSRHQLRASYSVSLAWKLPVIGFSSILLGVTVLRSLGAFLRTLFQSLGGSNEVVNYLFGLLNEALIALFVIILVAIFFVANTIQLTGYTISLRSNSRVTPSSGTKLTIASLFIVISVLFIIFLALFFVLSYFISTISIETLMG